MDQDFRLPFVNSQYSLQELMIIAVSIFPFKMATVGDIYQFILYNMYNLPSVENEQLCLNLIKNALLTDSRFVSVVPEGCPADEPFKIETCFWTLPQHVMMNKMYFRKRKNEKQRFQLEPKQQEEIDQRGQSNQVPNVTSSTTLPTLLEEGAVGGLGTKPDICTSSTTAAGSSQDLAAAVSRSFIKLHGRPPYSYYELILMAITNLPEGSANSENICRFILAHFPFYQSFEQDLRSSVRLTLIQSFIPRNPEEVSSSGTREDLPVNQEYEKQTNHFSGIEPPKVKQEAEPPRLCAQRAEHSNVDTAHDDLTDPSTSNQNHVDLPSEHSQDP